MPDKQLLEEFRLYRPKDLVLPRSRSDWPKPAIVASCALCGSDQTFNMLNSYDQYDEVDVWTRVVASKGKGPSGVVRLVYGCASCAKGRMFYLILVAQAPRRRASGIAPPETESAATLMKVGQYPPSDLRIGRDLESKLADDTQLYRKGLVSESQGYGIGAYAYYRRIVEALIDELLDDIAELVHPDQHSNFIEAVGRAKESNVASEKIAIVKELLPQSLRPAGSNPLSLLHGALSEGIHALSDEDCLEVAVSIREVLVYLVHQVKENRRSADAFATQMKKLLDRKSERTKEE